MVKMPVRGAKATISLLWGLFPSLFVVALCVLLAACSGRDAAGNTPADGAVAVDGALQTYCSGCHGPPSPDAHSPDEWPAVVARMQQRRAQKGMAAIPPAAREEIMRTLQGQGSDRAGST